MRFTYINSSNELGIVYLSTSRVLLNLCLPHVESFKNRVQRTTTDCVPYRMYAETGATHIQMVKKRTYKTNRKLENKKL